MSFLDSLNFLKSDLLLGGLVLAAAFAVLLLPLWYALDRKGFAKGTSDPTQLGYAVLAFLGAVVAFAVFLGYLGGSTNMPLYGRFLGAGLHVLLLVNLFVYVPRLLALVLPKTGAVALATYREGCRQPLFWLLIIFGNAAIWISVVLPYFTFGDDFKMMKQIGFDIIMFVSILFGALAASISIAEEIEGRTAITVMSKPINRRSFLLGKFLGILMACAAMSLILQVTLNFALVAAPEFDQINLDRSFDPMPEQAKAWAVPAAQSVMPAGPAKLAAEGIGKWAGEVFAHSFGILLDFGQVMILVAIATALATRLPFVVNLVVVLFVYFFGHLAPVVVRVTAAKADGGERSTGEGLVHFLAQLFDTLLPSLEFFNMGPAIIRDTTLDLGAFILYVLTVFFYSIIYTTIALIVGLLLFEDRDLA